MRRFFTQQIIDPADERGNRSPTVVSIQTYTSALRRYSLASYIPVSEIRTALVGVDRYLQSTDFPHQATSDLLNLLEVSAIDSCYGPAVAQAAVAYLQSQGIFGEMKNYVVKNRLGQGCRSEVFLAREKDRGRRVALKIYRAPFQEVREGDIPMGGIFNELRFQAVMNDDAIVRLLRCGLMAGSTPYLAFEYMSEGTLADWVKGLSLSDDCSITVPLLMVERLLQAAAFVHTSGVIHGDISLQNLLVGSQGQIKFADFAMARRLEERPYHFETITRKDDSPEGLAYDVFQLGKVLYQIFTRHPHEISDRSVQRSPAPSQRRPDLQIPTWIGELIRKSLQPNSAEHFPNAGAMRAFFQSHM